MANDLNNTNITIKYQEPKCVFHTVDEITCPICFPVRILNSCRNFEHWCPVCKTPIIKICDLCNEKIVDKGYFPNIMVKLCPQHIIQYWIFIQFVDELHELENKENFICKCKSGIWV